MKQYLLKTSTCRKLFNDPDEAYTYAMDSNLNDFEIAEFVSADSEAPEVDEASEHYYKNVVTDNMKREDRIDYRNLGC